MRKITKGGRSDAEKFVKATQGRPTRSSYS